VEGKPGEPTAASREQGGALGCGECALAAAGE